MGAGVLATPLKYLLNVIHSFLRQLSVLKEKPEILMGILETVILSTDFFSQQKLKNSFELLLEASFKVKKHSTADYEYGYSLNRPQTVFNI